MSYLCYLCSSLPPVVCMKGHVLFMLFVFVFISSCLYEGSCLIYVVFVFTSSCLYDGSCLIYVVFVFTSSCLYEGSCLIYVICVCLVRLYLQLFVGGLMSYLCYLCSSLSPVVCMKAHVLFMLFVFVFTSSCL